MKPANLLTALATHNTITRVNQGVMLSTVLVQVCDSQGTHKPCRVLLDCGSQANFISKKFLNSLGIKPRAVNVSINGINNTTTTATQMTQVHLQSRVNSFNVKVDCIVSEQVTTRLPVFNLRRSNFQISRNIRLADPQFHLSSDIDILVGADLFWKILCVGRIGASSEHPILQKTRFGWILAGRLGPSSSQDRSVHAFHASITNSQLNEQLTRFWQIEEIDNERHLTPEERQCEQHFLDNITRTS